jgi:hypothetical protein
LTFEYLRIGGTHRISWDLTDVAKGDVLPAAIDVVVSATIRAKVVHSDEDGLGEHRLALRIGPTWWCGGARGEIERQEFDPISRLDRQIRIPPAKEKRKSGFHYSFSFSPYGEREKKRGGRGAGVDAHVRHAPPQARAPPPFEKTHLFVGLAEGTLLERLTNIFAPAREEPGTVRGVVHEDDFSRRWLDDDHARRKEKIVRPETAVRDRRRRVSRVGSRTGCSHPGTIVVGGGSG